MVISPSVVVILMILMFLFGFIAGYRIGRK